MSDTSYPPPPTRLSAPPPRPRPRRMTKAPLIIGIGVLVFVLLAFYYVLTQQTKQVESTKPTSAQLTGAADPGEALKNEPKTDMVGDAFGSGRPDARIGVQGAALPVPREKPKPPEPGMTTTEIEGRKQAWNEYYRSLADIKRDRIKAIQDAAAGDAATTPVPRPQHQAGGQQNMAGGLPGIPGQGMQAMAGAGGMGGGGMGGGGVVQAGSQLNLPQSGGNDGLASESGYPPGYLTAQQIQPISPYEVKMGDIIPCQTVSGLTNETKGQIKAVVSQTVFDHATGMHPLIPQGSTLIGIYDTNQNYGDERLAVAFTSIIYPPPGDERLDIGGMEGGDIGGYAGMSDEIDRHIGRIIFNAALQGVFGLSVPLTQQAISGSMGQPILSAGNQLTQRGMDVKPTLRIKPGYACSLQLTKDIAFEKPWSPSPGPIPLFRQ